MHISLQNNNPIQPNFTILHLTYNTQTSQQSYKYLNLFKPKNTNICKIQTRFRTNTFIKQKYRNVNELFKIILTDKKQLICAENQQLTSQVKEKLIQGEQKQIISEEKEKLQQEKKQLKQLEKQKFSKSNQFLEKQDKQQKKFYRQSSIHAYSPSYVTKSLKVSLKKVDYQSCSKFKNLSIRKKYINDVIKCKRK